jgi:hypothetical protein
MGIIETGKLSQNFEPTGNSISFYITDSEGIFSCWIHSSTTCKNKKAEPIKDPALSKIN